MQAARTRARRRLLGAAVLVGLGIVGFPLLFETQPRPIPVDIPIEVGARASAPAPQVARPPASAPAAVARAQPAAPVDSEAEAPVAASAPPPSASAAEAPVQPVARAASMAAETEQRDAQRAQALLEGKSVAALPPAAEPKAAPRFVVQAGAYTDAGSLREARQKVEKLGLKTYTQVIETDSGARTRVRVGPFDNRDEAEKAAARIKSAGLAANVLSL